MENLSGESFDSVIWQEKLHKNELKCTSLMRAVLLAWQQNKRIEFLATVGLQSNKSEEDLDYKPATSNLSNKLKMNKRIQFLSTYQQ